MINRLLLASYLTRMSYWDTLRYNAARLIGEFTGSLVHRDVGTAQRRMGVAAWGTSGFSYSRPSARRS